VGNVPAVNTLDSVFFSTQRALMIAELKRIQAKLGKDVFPLIPIRYYPNTKHNLPKPKDLPLVRSTLVTCVCAYVRVHVRVCVCVCDSTACCGLLQVAKVGTSHAGYGKMKFKDDDFSDFSTLMAM
jgi:hypothetical protein